LIPYSVNHRIPLRLSIRESKPGLRSRLAVHPLHGFIRPSVCGHIPDRYAHGFSLSEHFLSVSRTAVIQRQSLVPLPGLWSVDSRMRVSCVTATQSTHAVLRRCSDFPRTWPFPVLQPETACNLGPASEICTHGKSFTWMQACFSLYQVRALTGFCFLRLSPQSGATVGFPTLPLLWLSAPFHFGDVASNIRNGYGKHHPLQGITLRTERVDQSRFLPL